MQNIDELFNEYYTDRNAVVEELKGYIMSSYKSINALSKEIGITPMTLKTIVHNPERTITFVTWRRIKHFLNKMYLDSDVH